MSFFSMGKKPESNKSYSLADIPLFSDLPQVDIKTVEKRTRLVEFHKNDRVYSQGDAPDAFYVIVSGRFQVLQKKPDGTDEKVVNLYRNDYFGEISILTNQPHSVTVRALNDALAIRIDRDDFTKILSQVPSLSLHLSRLLGRRLVARDERKAVEHAEIVSMYGCRPGLGKTAFVINLSVAIRTELNKEVIMVNLNPPAASEKSTAGGSFAAEDLNISNWTALEKYVLHHKLGFDYMNVFQKKPVTPEIEHKITSLLTFLVSRYHFVLIDLFKENQDLAFKVLSQSDVVYILTDEATEHLEKCRLLSKQLKDTFHHKEDSVKILLCEQTESQRFTNRQRQNIAGQRLSAVLPFVSEHRDNIYSSDPPLVLRESHSPYARTVRYLARELGNALVGLALGSGAAFGLAHIGVLKVLEEESVPIDIIAGSSIGALLGGFWAGGMRAKQMEELALSFNAKNSFFRLVGFGDIMMPHWGIFKGNRIEHFMRQYLGNKTFEDLEIPLRVVATNLATSEPEIFEDGDLVKALRASCSIPGIFRAVRHGGKILVDGGIADPLPVEVLVKMGVKKIIAVNVLSGPKDHLERREAFRRRREIIEQQSQKKGPWHRFWSGVERRFLYSQTDNIFNVLMSTIQFMEYSIAVRSGIGADIMIHPVVIDSHWAEFFSAEKFVKVGEEKTREAMSEIRALLEL